MTLTPSGYRPRIVDGRIAVALESRGIVRVDGAMGCGRTWTSMNQANSVLDLNDRRGLGIATLDHDYALRGNGPRLIDGDMTIPGLADEAVQKTASGDGRFILTCRRDYGEIGTIRMRTMSLFESGDSDGSVSLRGLFASEFGNTPMSDVHLEDLARLVVRGGWPDGRGVPDDYVMRACRTGLPIVDRSRDPDRAARLMGSLARSEGALTGASALARDMREHEGEDMWGSTVSGYLEALRALRLLDDQQAFTPVLDTSVNVGKAPRHRLADPSIAASLLGLSEESMFDDPDAFERLFGSLCVRDLDVYSGSMGGRVLHYRDGAGRTLDAVVEMQDGRWAAFGIILSAERIDDAARNLRNVTRYISERSESEFREPEFLCVICGMESAAYRREDGVYVVPITRLRD